jgi:hypothetical protein
VDLVVLVCIHLLQEVLLQEVVVEVEVVMSLAALAALVVEGMVPTHHLLQELMEQVVVVVGSGVALMPRRVVLA